MPQSIVFSEDNLKLVCFSSLYGKKESDLINALFSYKLLQHKKITKDIKSLFLHYTIFNLCEDIRQIKSVEKTVLYVNDGDLIKCELAAYYTQEQVLKLFKECISYIQKYLPFCIYIGNINFSCVKLLKNGEKKEFIFKVKNQANKLDLSNFTFSKMYTFTKKNNLVFLNKEYFNTLKARQLLLT
jgi:hypothetical protein